MKLSMTIHSNGTTKKTAKIKNDGDSSNIVSALDVFVELMWLPLWEQ